MAALLNTDLFEYFCALVSNKARSGYLRAFSDYIQQIPIPPATSEEKARLATLAEQCAAATAAGDAETLAAREHELNQLVHRLFHLTPAEIALIEGSAGISE